MPAIDLEQLKGIRLRGVVKTWRMGFGFIRPDGWERDIFVHWTCIQSDDHYKQLNEGDRVEFEIGEGNNKLQANSVIRIER
jgi:cold shock protein